MCSRPLSPYVLRHATAMGPAFWILFWDRKAGCIRHWLSSLVCDWFCPFLSDWSVLQHGLWFDHRCLKKIGNIANIANIGSSHSWSHHADRYRTLFRSAVSSTSSNMHVLMYRWTRNSGANSKLILIEKATTIKRIYQLEIEGEWTKTPEEIRFWRISSVRDILLFNSVIQ